MSIHVLSTAYRSYSQRIDHYLYYVLGQTYDAVTVDDAETYCVYLTQCEVVRPEVWLRIDY